MEINRYIEHTILAPDATVGAVEKVIKEAIEYDFLGFCINPNYVDFAKNYLKDYDKKPKIVTVVNFPLASSNLQTIVFQTAQAVLAGADEIDTVINLSALKDKNYKKVEEDIRETKKACAIAPLKVILETDLLTKEEIKIASEIAANAGANFVKTSTGFVKGGVGAKVEDVKLMFETVSEAGLGVKASGGIKTREQALALIEAGATRLGTSSGVSIQKG